MWHFKTKQQQLLASHMQPVLNQKLHHDEAN